MVAPEVQQFVMNSGSSDTLMMYGTIAQHPKP